MFNPCPKPIRIKLSPKKRAELREKLWKEQGEKCIDCGRWVNLHGDTIFNTAHLAHKKSVGSGGEDTKNNTCIKCFFCHIIKEHGLKWGQ